MPASPDAATILLTAADPVLAAAIARALPQCPVLPFASVVPDLPPGARVIAFIDWLPQGIAGIELVRRLRENPATAAAHITMVLEADEVEDRRRALRAGADDYLVGPLSPEQAIERIRARLGAGAGPVPHQRLRHGELTLDLSAHQARFRGSPVPLRPNEFRLLAHFVTHPDQVFSRSALIERLGKHAEGIDERTVDVWVGRLRRGLTQHGAPDPLRTVRALGYVLDSLDH